MFLDQNPLILEHHKINTRTFVIVTFNARFSKQLNLFLDCKHDLGKNHNFRKESITHSYQFACTLHSQQTLTACHSSGKVKAVLFSIFGSLFV